VPSTQPSLLVFAAVSLQGALLEAASTFEAQEGARVDLSFAGSNVLARQIEAAPVADVYFSASVDWMERLAAKERIVPGSRRDLLSNELQVVAHSDSRYRVDTAAEIATLGAAFLSIGDPRAVPAGIYAKAFLETVAVGEGTAWDALAPRVAPAPDVRAAMGMVEQRPDVIGIVYRTDAHRSQRVRVLYTVPPEEAPSIRYSVALVHKESVSPVARALLAFLGSDAAAQIFIAHGFTIAEQE
jgi:molybdate transport system substrate-binding protein